MTSGISSAGISLRDALPSDSTALIQARRNFFARTVAYNRCRTFVAESDGQIVGVNCVALNPVRVAGRPCMAGYSFNTRVVQRVRGRGVGTLLMRAAAAWVEEQLSLIHISEPTRQA